MTPHSMSVAEAIRTRRTVRHYRPDAISPTVIDELLDLAIEAPTSWNLQDRSIVVVTGDEGRAGLAWATGGQPQPQEAPLMLVFVAEPLAWREDRSDVYEQARRNGAWNDEFVTMFSGASQAFQADLEERGLLREYAIKDAMIAAAYVMLTATEMGLASSPMNGWDEAAVKQVIGVARRGDARRPQVSSPRRAHGAAGRAPDRSTLRPPNAPAPLAGDGSRSRGRRCRSGTTVR
ncbi:nitroreductase family protein [Nocardia cyriacigeorgica]|uniref:nitroreductase family protein n=1 Tax=Nocardia cyriacigeorgica TaxID=135487 RepID=UPI001E49B61E|nr:nitroreductase family protein [Nocardia cyriacigeorgica]